MNILLIVTGSISAYKAIDLSNELRRRNHTVRVVMTESASKFITPLVFRGQRHECFVDADEWSYPLGVLHVNLANWADAVVVAPATANTIAKYLHGVTDNLALSVLRVWRGTVYFAPAMNTGMYENIAPHLAALAAAGAILIKPQHKLLACGVTGIGGLARV
jgi:phosphopantothenoylcysteine decarboxylase/phosphopantothenate--cysteine ligase